MRIALAQLNPRSGDIAAMILPYRKPQLYQNSPISRYKVAGIPLMCRVGVHRRAMLIFERFLRYLWLQGQLTDMRICAESLLEAIDSARAVDPRVRNLAPDLSLAPLVEP